MAECKRQHYVPQFYLREFAGHEGKAINLLVLESSKIVVEASVAHQCYESYFYGADARLEKALRDKFETPTAPILRKIIETDKLPAEGTEEYVMMFSFVLLQHGRTVYAAEEISELRNLLAQTVADGGDVKKAEAALKGDEDSGLNLENPVLMSLKHSTEMLPFALDLRAMLLVNKTDEDFITSDHPIAMFNPYFAGSYPGSVTGWGREGLQVMFPLSPRLTLCLYDSAFYRFGDRKSERVEINSIDDVRWLNKAQLLSAEECVYFADAKQGFRVERLLAEVKGLKRGDKLGSRTADGGKISLVHAFKNDIKLLGKLGVCKILKSQGVVPMEKRNCGSRNPHLAGWLDLFEEEIRSGRYKADQLYEFLQDSGAWDGDVMKRPADYRH